MWYNNLERDRETVREREKFVIRRKGRQEGEREGERKRYTKVTFL